MVHFGEHLKTEACGQKVLPDRSVFIGQKLVEKAKIQKFKCDNLSNFQTLCKSCKRHISICVIGFFPISNSVHLSRLTSKLISASAPNICVIILRAN